MSKRDNGKTFGHRLVPFLYAQVEKVGRKWVYFIEGGVKRRESIAVFRSLYFEPEFRF